MFHLYAVEVLDNRTGEVIREQLIEATSKVEARRLARDYIASDQHIGFAFVEE